MVPASVIVPTYRCPGETYEIPRGVHLARLAAGYDRCEACPHREGPHANPGTDLSSVDEASFRRHGLFTAEGVRGVHLNELTRTDAVHIAGAFASGLWDELGRGDEAHSTASRPEGNRLASGAAREGITLLSTGRPGPLIVLAHDERSSSPDLVVGIGGALRRMGCQVVDIGPVTRPGFWFAVHQLHAAGGIQASGSGCDPAWTGMDFVRQGVLPCSRGAELDAIEQRSRDGYGRPSRRPGSQRLYSAAIAYEAGLGKHFHALRPLKIVLGCPNRLLRELLERIFRKLACRLIPVPMPMRARRLDDDRDPDVSRVAAAVRGNGAHFGILIDDDAQSCALFDDSGARAAPGRVLPLLGAVEREARPGGVAVDETTNRGATLEMMARALRQPEALCGADAAGRYWFVEAFPNCDAVLTLIKLLQLLSRADTPFSDLLAGVSR